MNQSLMQMEFVEFDPRKVAWVLEKDDLRTLLLSIREAHFAVLDLETTGLTEHAWYGSPLNEGYPSRIALASLTLVMPNTYSAPSTWVIPLSHPDSPWRAKHRQVMAKIAYAMVKHSIRLINHNVKFDVRWVYAQTGIDLVPLIYWDSMMSSHLLDENLPGDLKSRVPAEYGVAPWNDFPLDKPGAAERVPMIQLGVYAAQDTYYTWHLAAGHMRRMFDGLARATHEPGPDELPMFADEVEDARLGKLNYWSSVPTVQVLTRMEERGLGFDVEFAEQKRDEANAEISTLAEKLAGLYGFDPAKMSWSRSKIFDAWTEAAVEAGDLRVSKITAAGSVSWDKKVLGRQARAGSQVAADLLTLRQAEMRRRFIDSWLGMLSKERRIHATYRTGKVVTGRLSSADPNMQQVMSSLRPCFVPPEGYYIADLDYSQIEMRVAAFLSRSEAMMDAFVNGTDTHKLMAMAITGKHLEEITKDERQAGKSANFGLLYGMSVEGFIDYAEDTYGVHFTYEEGEVVHRAYFDLWDGLREWHNNVATHARRVGQVSSPIGRVRRLPGVFDSNPRRQSDAIRAGINSPVQGFASDLMQMSAASIEGVLPRSQPVPGAQLVGTVHDSIFALVPQDDWEAAATGCQERMVGIVGTLKEAFHLDFDVPLVADLKVGTRWGLDDVSEAM